MDTIRETENRLKVTLSRIPYPYNSWITGYELIKLDTNEEKFHIFLKEDSDCSLFTDVFSKLSVLNFNEEVVITYISQK